MLDTKLFYPAAGLKIWRLFPSIFWKSGSQWWHTALIRKRNFHFNIVTPVCLTVPPWFLVIFNFATPILETERMRFGGLKIIYMTFFNYSTDWYLLDKDGGRINFDPEAPKTEGWILLEFSKGEESQVAWVQTFNPSTWKTETGRFWV